ncbi:hypothetical protein ABEB36_006506 [Hypothenemus hampei]|uniref:Digestive organ expansion factor homolog n=1 Tax=Hypothenemus hampei TaxID=57062 RepID=A0ABD1EQS2_HYPHA
MGKKLKYRDVVKREGPKTFNKRKLNKSNNKNNEKRNKTISNGSFKRKLNQKKNESNKRIRKNSENEHKVEEPIQNQSSESDSEDAVTVDYMKLLRDSFGDKIQKVSNEAVSSESSSSEEELEEESDKTELHKPDEIEREDDDDNDDDDDDNDDDEDDNNDVQNDTQQEEDTVDDSHDPFVKHVCYELHPNLLQNLQSESQHLAEIHKITWPKLGELLIRIPKCETIETVKHTLLDTTTYAIPSPIPKKLHPKDYFIKPQILPNLHLANKSVIKQEETILSSFQQEMFSIINNYQDFYFPERTFDNAEDIRFVYSLHAINHILKTRIKILHHNSKLGKREDVPEEYRDQGLVRPKVLIVVPFKDSAYKVINCMINIMFQEDKGNVVKKLRFVEDYTGNQLYFPKKNPKPDDYEKTFCGNIGDDFKIGLTVTKKSLKLYSDFYSSDIIVASPLGLRTIIKAPGEPDRDFDFLTSIELLILDQTDIFFMQNWFHVMHLFDHLHLKPKELHGTDVSRVRQWCLNLWSKYYRQTLIFSSCQLPHIEALFTKNCTNFAGKVKVANRFESGKINEVYVQMQHIFHKFNAASPVEMVEKRFEFFVEKVLPLHRDTAMTQTLIFIPSYYDYVRIRNHFKKEDVSFVQICEYSKESKVARARDMFFHGDAHFLLYTERYHFYNRIRIKGIRHLIFYQLPCYSHFYSEMCNLMQEFNMNKKVGSMDNMTVSVIYTKYDILQLAPLLGTERAVRMLESERDVHMLLTERR